MQYMAEWCQQQRINCTICMMHTSVNMELLKGSCEGVKQIYGVFQASLTIFSLVLWVRSHECYAVWLTPGKQSTQTKVKA